MRRNIQSNYKNTNFAPPQTSRNYNVSSTQQHRLNQPNLSNIQTTEASMENQTEKTGLNNQVTEEQNIQSQEMQETYNPSQENNESNVINCSEDFRIRQINVTNKLKNVLPTTRTNYENISVPSLINKTNNYKNVSRNGGKNIKFNVNERQGRNNNIRDRLIEKNHARAKSYFTERKNMSNYLPKQDEAKKRLSHSVEVKRKTIVRGDKYNNIQITHIISSSKPNLSKYNFHITEQLSTSELHQKPFDLTKIKLYIKKDPTAKSFYNTSCRNVPLKSAEKILKTTFYQHAGGRGMTNLKSSNINTKFYQSGIIKLPLKVNKREPIVKIINEFRSELPLTNRNASLGEKYNSNYSYNNRTFNGLNSQRNNIPIHQENTKNKLQKLNDKENEEKNKLSSINYNNQNKVKNILPITSRGNTYTTKTYTSNNRYMNNNTYKPKEERHQIVVNVNTRLNKNFYTNNQNQSLNINNAQKQVITQSYKNNNINTRVNIPTIKTENKIENEKDNLNETPLRINSGRSGNIKPETEKPKYINKLPLTNINNSSLNQNINEQKSTPTKAEQNASFNLDSGRKQNINIIENKPNIISNIKPSTVSRNINNITIQKNIVVSNTNKNKTPSTITYINSNRYDNKYKNTNRNNVVQSSQRPVINQNYQRPQPQLNNIVATSSIKKPEVKPEENKIQISTNINPEKNVSNLGVKGTSEEKKNVIAIKTPSNAININNNVKRTPNIVVSNIKVNNNIPNKYKNSNVKIASKPQERKITTINPINTSKYTINTSNSKIPSRNEVKSNINTSKNIPVTVNKNINTQEKPKYRCITYSRPEQNMTNVTHYINKISSKSKEKDKNPIQSSNLKNNKNDNTGTSEFHLEKPEVKNQEILKPEEKEKIENNNIKEKENVAPQHIEINLEEKKEDSTKLEEKKEEKVEEIKPEEQKEIKDNEKKEIKEEINIVTKEEMPAETKEEIKEEKPEETKEEVKEEKPIEKIEEVKEEKPTEEIKKEIVEEKPSENIEQIKDENPDKKIQEMKEDKLNEKNEIIKEDQPIEKVEENKPNEKMEETKEEKPIESIEEVKAEKPNEEIKEKSQDLEKEKDENISEEKKEPKTLEENKEEPIKKTIEETKIEPKIEIKDETIKEKENVEQEKKDELTEKEIKEQKVDKIDEPKKEELKLKNKDNNISEENDPKLEVEKVEEINQEIKNSKPEENQEIKDDVPKVIENKIVRGEGEIKENQEEIKKNNENIPEKKEEEIKNEIVPQNIVVEQKVEKEEEKKEELKPEIIEDNKKENPEEIKEYKKVEEQEVKKDVKTEENKIENKEGENKANNQGNVIDEKGENIPEKKDEIKEEKND